MKVYHIITILLVIATQFFSIFSKGWLTINLTFENISYLSMNTSLYNITNDSSSYNSFLLIIFGIILLSIGLVMIILNKKYSFIVISLGSLLSIIACILSIDNIKNINQTTFNQINSASSENDINLKNPFVPNPVIPSTVLKKNANIKQNAFEDNISITINPGYSLYLNLISSIITLFLSMYIYKTNL